MNLERGFRRVVVALSLGLLCTGLGLTAYGSYVTYQYVSYQLSDQHSDPLLNIVHERCVRDVGPRLNRLFDAGRLSFWEYAERLQASVWECEEHWGLTPRLPATLAKAVEVWRGALPVSVANRLPVWVAGWDHFSYGLVVLPAIWGALLTAGLSAVPWGAFYLMRWIVRGFRDGR